MTIKETIELQDCHSIHKELNRLVIRYHSKQSTTNREKQEDNINMLFEELYRKSLSENYFWQYCPSKVFEQYFEEAYQSFLAKNIDTPITNFHVKLLDLLFKNTKRPDRGAIQYVESSGREISLGTQLYDYQEDYLFTIDKTVGKTEIQYLINFLNNENIEFIKSSQDKKITYILTKFLEIVNSPIKKSSKLEPEVFQDFSDNSAAEKIVFLHQLGIIEFLYKKQPFNTSINKLAEVISTFTGISQTTAQSYLNPIISKEVKNKNNPLTKKNLDIVSKKLIKIGYIEQSTASSQE